MPDIVFSYLMVIPAILTIVLLAYSVRPLSEFTRLSFLSAVTFALSFAETFAGLLMVICLNNIVLQVMLVGFVTLKGSLGITLYETEISKEE
jgi:hypothetical protein